jgi:hypothetical protein
VGWGDGDGDWAMGLGLGDGEAAGVAAACCCGRAHETISSVMSVQQAKRKLETKTV